MSHIQSHHGGAEGTHDTFLVVLKVHGNSIHLWSRDRMEKLGKTHEFTIACQSVGSHLDGEDLGIEMMMLGESPAIQNDRIFQEQQPGGQMLQADDLVIFITKPISTGRKASYAIDLALVWKVAQNQQTHGIDSYEKIGSSYLYLDPEFSTQGLQRSPILGAYNHMPVGQLQVEYLIVTNPIGYGVASSKPEWLFIETGLDVGHRGAGSGRRSDLPEDLLENTIDSFNYAHRHGADICELDVLITADGIPIVYHDFDVDAVTAQQSSNDLGKLRVQVNQFTHKQLRDFRLLKLHDDDGCPFTLTVPNQAEGNRPFPTLAEVLEKVDMTCGFNIEIKWPQLLENGHMEAKRFREINDFVSKIINVLYEHAYDRRIVLGSFDADLMILLRLKQDRFPVVFLNQGMTDRYERYVDLRARSIWNGIYFAQAFDFAGIDIIADYYFKFGKELVDFIRSHKLVARAWGDLGDSREKLELLKSLGIQCITYDKVDLMKNENLSSINSTDSE